MLIEAGVYKALVEHSRRVTIANRILRILEETCGVSKNSDESWRFINYFADPPYDQKEYRLQSELGSGGKFYVNAGRWYVGCYPEDRTPERDAMIVEANQRLVALKEEEDARPIG